MSLEGKVIVITGASSGVGRAAALEFSGHGTSLVLAARNENALNGVADLCRSAGASVMTVTTDVSNADAVKALASSAWHWHDRIDVWVNNAGVLAAGGFEETPIEVHRQVILTNLMGYTRHYSILPVSCTPQITQAK
jgi:NAD(P)-dependent dehydrogenase (short-subunit alcohol dehydrogenase family)